MLNSSDYAKNYASTIGKSLDCASTRGFSPTLPKLRFENEGKCGISEM